ncbi:YHS domain-containing protein [Cellulomonas sp. Leaf395]|uniref:YHS domain-containing protein n=1 Tax=Cellulomonas sp. Leaf395 TaxID=1736362 RepID=UPI0006F27EA1|nr:YHS domain-containing protein [Cellulomonas sp. Leaf395]KQS98737.1 hypothetical protein ASG23_13410 [Cellulomonas sp. Leaf395]
MTHQIENATADASCCGHSASTTPAPAQASSCHSGTSQPNLLAPTGDDVTTCPVMAGSTVVKAVAEAAGLFRDYQGERYWFCCAGCGPMFDADPDKYVTAA